MMSFWPWLPIAILALAAPLAAGCGPKTNGGGGEDGTQNPVYERAKDVVFLIGSN